MKSIICQAKDLPVMVLNLVQDDFTYEPYEAKVSVMTNPERWLWEESEPPQSAGCPPHCSDPSHDL